MLRVTKPVCSSMARLKRGSAYGVVDDERLARGEHVPGDARGVEEPDLALDVALRDARVELVGRGVVEEQRTALGAHLGRGHLHQRVQHVVEVVEGRDAARDVEQQLDHLQAAVADPRPGPRARPRRACGLPGGRRAAVAAIFLVESHHAPALAAASCSCSRSARTVASSWATSLRYWARTASAPSSRAACARSISTRSAAVVARSCAISSSRAGKGVAHALVGVEPRALQRVAQAGDGLAHLRDLVLAGRLRVPHHFLPDAALALELVAQGEDRAAQLRHLAARRRRGARRARLGIGAGPLQFQAQRRQRAFQLADLGFRCGCALRHALPVTGKRWRVWRPPGHPRCTRRAPRRKRNRRHRPAPSRG